MILTPANIQIVATASDAYSGQTDCGPLILRIATVPKGPSAVISATLVQSTCKVYFTGLPWPLRAVGPGTVFIEHACGHTVSAKVSDGRLTFDACQVSGVLSTNPGLAIK